MANSNSEAKTGSSSSLRSMIQSMSPSAKNWFMFFYWGILIVVTVFLYPLYNRIYPLVLGLPFSVFMLLLLAVLIALGFIIFYFIEEIRGEL